MTLASGEFRHRSLPDQVADHIVTLIAKGEIDANERLYENELCKMLGVSRIPVREALRILQAQGVVRTAPNRGSYVNQFGSEETTEMLKIRLTVERLALRRVVPMVRKDAAVLAPLYRALERMRSLNNNKDKLAACQADIDFHQSLVVLAGSPTLTTVWEMLARGIIVFIVQERQGYYDDVQNIRDHEELLRAIEIGKLAVLDDVIEAHILHPSSRKAPEPPRPDPAAQQ